MSPIAQPPMGRSSHTNKFNMDVYQILRAYGVGVFYATKTGDQAIANATLTLLEFEADSFNGPTWYDNGTDKYSPKQRGFYQINAAVSITPGGGASAGEVKVGIYKNNSLDIEFPTIYADASVKVVAGGSAIVKANGSSDYFTLKITHTLGVSSTMASADTQSFQGVFVSPLGY